MILSVFHTSSTPLCKPDQLFLLRIEVKGEIDEMESLVNI